jgi:hypothetical protein
MTTRTISGLYDSYDAATQTVRDLEAADIPHSDISIVAHEYIGGVTAGAETGASAGAVIGGGAGLLAGLGVLAIPGVGPVVAAGWLVATAVGAVAGAAAGGATGSLIGSMTSAGVSQDDANFYAEGVRRGGTLVTARVDEERVATAELIMNRRGRIDRSTREHAYRDAGWKGFDEKSAPYTPAEITRERLTYQNRP